MNYERIALILGNCLFPNHGALGASANTLFVMIEDYGLCTHYRYHKHKLVLFLSAMRSHGESLRKSYDLVYIQLSETSKTKTYEEHLQTLLKEHDSVSEIITYDIEDHFFEERIVSFCTKNKLCLTQVDSPAFLTTKDQFHSYFKATKKPFMHVFYQQQRKRLGVLVDEQGKPNHGRWSFDEENRRKLPKNIGIPALPDLEYTNHTKEVFELVDGLFPDHPGSTGNFCWATTRAQVQDLLENFLKQRFQDFGPYEDAIDEKEVFLFHSVLSPYINMGLITPKEILTKTLAHYEVNQTYFPSVEGFVRQIIGWREFIRGIYHECDTVLNVNHFNHQRKMKACWYDGSTGIPPLDDSIQKAQKYGYTHHIERLMVLGNCMLLCEIDPEEVYRWFMEMYVDSADWVMAPNVYGMSQFADGGIFATKPYIGGANYIRKMSRYATGEWEDVLNGLYWRFIAQNQELFEKNNRMSMMAAMLKKMDIEKKERIFSAAETFLLRVTE